ncbi:Isochorismatase-like protein [Xylaria venustula]|nr:Isochorismatase-like protein [Xylaria venustula]
MDKTAFILLDIQIETVGMISHILNTDEYLAKVSSTLTAARKAGVPIVQVTTSFRPSYVDTSPRNRMTTHVRDSGKFKESDPFVQLHPTIAKEAADDIYITKRRVSALYGNDLDIVLRSSGIEKIVVAGLATTGAVLSTVRQAADMDYQITVIADLCADSSDELHRFAMSKVLSKQASILSAEEWLASLEK